MTDLINGRTPEEIKRWVDGRATCNTCPKEHEVGCEDGERTEDCQMTIDTIAYIERLESERDAALAKVPKWISVEERLPEKDGEYLVLKVHNYRKDDGYMAQEVALFLRTRDPEWVIGNLCEVTHWMPMPKTPEETNKHGRTKD